MATPSTRTPTIPPTTTANIPTTTSNAECAATTAPAGRDKCAGSWWGVWKGRTEFDAHGETGSVYAAGTGVFGTGGTADV
jgi:hypothetical protein